MTSGTPHLLNHNLARQLLDYHLIDELAAGLPTGYAARIQGKLSKYDVRVAKGVIYARARAVRDKPATLSPAAEFHGVPGRREGKDLNYAGFWAMVDLALPKKADRSYVGLPSRQLCAITEHIGGKIVACERKLSTVIQMCSLKLLAEKKSRSTISLWPANIFAYLDKNRLPRFNVFDLDLMCIMPPRGELFRWAELICDNIRGKVAAVNLTATVGRSITEREHDKRVKYLKEALAVQGFREQGNSRFAYRDRQTPMRAERIILERR